MAKRGAKKKKKKSKPRKKATTGTVDSRTGLQRQKMKTRRIARTSGPVMLTIGPRQRDGNGQEPFRILINRSTSPAPGGPSRGSSRVTIRTSARSQQASGNESRITISYDPDGNIVLSSGESKGQRGSEIRISKGGGGSSGKERSGSEMPISKGQHGSSVGSRSSHEAIQALRNDLSLLLKTIVGKSATSSSAPSPPDDGDGKEEPVMKTHSPKSYVGPTGGGRTAAARPKKRAAPKRKRKPAARRKGGGRQKRKKRRAGKPRRKAARRKKKKKRPRKGKAQMASARGGPRSKGGRSGGAARSKGSPASGAARSKGRQDVYSIRESKHVQRRRQIRTPVSQGGAGTSTQKSLRESDEQHRDLRQSDHGHPVGPTLKDGSKEVYQRAPKPAPNKIRYSKNRPTSSSQPGAPTTKKSSTTSGAARSKATAGRREQKPSTASSKSAEAKKGATQEEEQRKEATVEEAKKPESDQDKPAQDDAEGTQPTTKGTVGPGGVRKAPTTNAGLMVKETPAANKIQFFPRDNRTQGNKPQSKKSSAKDVQQHIPDG